MSEAELVSTDPSILSVMPNHSYADSYTVRVPRPLSARAAAEAAFAKPPVWVTRLMALRNLLVRPFGLKAAADPLGHDDRIGGFPVVSETPERVILGFDDKHLDFRIVLDCRSARGSTWVIATTLVKTKNRFGRFYLTIILPFHRAITKAILQAI